MGLFKKFINQTRKPEGVLGRMMVGGMNGGHARLANWGMSHLRGFGASNIIELGCGGGRNAGELLNRYPKACVTAVDYSDISVQKAKQYNEKAITAGRCKVIQGNVAKLPFEGEIYDLATAFETVYFWPGLTKCFSEVYRVLKPGSSFLICNESDGIDKASLKYEKIIDGMKCYTTDQLTAALKEAGFSEVSSYHHLDHPWLTMIARKC